MNIYINDKNTIPDDDTCYIIAKGGIYLKKKLDLIESLTPVDKISFLEDINSFAKMNIPLIPTRMFGNILGFFREVYNLYKSEAIVLLFYNKDKKSYKIYVPEQEVSGASLSYKTDKTIKNHVLVGSIHSHGSMSAFHSGTDIGDEKSFDGIHMTVGKISDPNFFELCGSIVANGLRVPISPEEYVNGIEYREYTPYFPTMFRPGFEEINGDKIYKNTVKTSSGCILNAREEDYNFNKKWLENVKEKQSSYTTSLSFTGGKTKYIYKDGQLIKVNDNNKNESGNLFNSFLDNIDKKYNGSCVCKHCVHRDEKLKMTDFIDVEEKDLVQNFEFYSDYLLWD